MRTWIIWIAAVGLSLAARQADAQTLKADPVASGAFVTLGDLFAGVGDKATLRVAAAPRPGLSLSLDAGFLARKAQEAGLAWTPSPTQPRILVRSVAAAPAASPLRAAQAARAGANEPGYALAPIRPIPAGAALSEADVELIALDNPPPDAITDLEALRGLAARRVLRPGLALRQSDLRAPLVVRRGEPVTVAVKGAQFALTLQGRAMNDAERGQIVRVLNPQSRAIVEAVAVSAGLAETFPRASALITAERP